jgi:predicted ATPase
MEAWPFFVISATMGSLIRNMAVYFEEPETHLHPQAQVEVMKTIAFLTGRGHNFMITTHSPFLLYATNNMIQRYMPAKKKGLIMDRITSLKSCLTLPWSVHIGSKGHQKNFWNRED